MNDIVRASILHAPVLAAMHKISFTAAWSEKDMAETLGMAGAFAFLAAGNPPQGYVIGRAIAGESEILSIMVAPPFRRKGVAKQLMSMAFRESEEGGAEMMFLEVDTENYKAQSFYEGLGFYTVGLRPRYYGDKDAFIMRKDFVASSS